MTPEILTNHHSVRTEEGGDSSTQPSYAPDQYPDKVLKTIAANRSPESYLAGATALQRDSDTPRFSQDLGLFHDLEESVALCAETDAATLRDAVYEFSWVLLTPAFCRAVLSAEGQQLKIEWALDSAFRFSPVQEDDRCGYLAVADIVAR